MTDLDKLDHIEPDSRGGPFVRALDALCITLIDALEGIENVQRQFHPFILPRLRERLPPLVTRLETAQKDFRLEAPPQGFEGLQDQLTEAADLLAGVLHLITTPGFLTDALRHPTRSDFQEAMAQILQAVQQYSRAQEVLFHYAETFRLSIVFFWRPQCMNGLMNSILSHRRESSWA